MRRDLLPAQDSEALYRRLIKRLGRNAQPRDGAEEHGALDEGEACSLWSALLGQRFSPAQEAALLMGLRVHGESASMLAAFVRATRPHLHPVRGPGTAVAVLHCFGTPRKQPSLAPLLALRLVEAGTPTLIVTPPASAASGTATVLPLLGVTAALDADDAACRLAADQLAWVRLDTIAPSLARLIARRSELGFRNSAHTVSRLLSPISGPARLLAHYTHGAYRASLARAIELLELDAVLVRGTEGDPVAWVGHAHPALAWQAGRRIELDSEPPSLPRPELAHSVDDPLATARFIDAVMRGAARCPAALDAQAMQLAKMTAEKPTEATCPGE
jgi:anthranilate phosphoribosyltransferase